MAERRTASICLIGALGLGQAATAQTAAPPPVPAVSPREADVALEVPGRESDARVARIAFRLASAGHRRCPTLQPNPGLLLQHLSQFTLADRAGVIATLPLDRGPGVIAVVQGGPGAAAGVRAGDILLAIDGVPLPPEPGLAAPFDAARARARADQILDLLATAAAEPRTLALLRNGATVTVRLSSRPTCPSQVHLARSEQRNAFADGRHVFLTTGLLARLDNDDELAFVIAHELAHNILGHAALLRGGDVAHGIARAPRRSASVVRRTEQDADMLAGALLLDAGYDPVRGAQALVRLSAGDTGLGLFADHRSDADRIAAMRALAQARQSR